MISFERQNVNFKGKKTSDCVIRALCKASGRKYEEVAKELFDIYMKTGYMVNDKHCYEKWLEQNGFTKFKQPRHSDKTKYLVGEIEDLAPSEGGVVISLANHLTSVYDGVLYDLWDCRHKTIGNYWYKED